jgi:transcriptional regulator with XRE-family HTH domain
MKKIGDIRRENLREIISRQPSQKAVAIKAGIAPAYLSQILTSEKRKPGRKICRAIETAYKLGEKWLDEDRNLQSKIEINAQYTGTPIYDFAQLEHGKLIKNTGAISSDILSFLNLKNHFGVEISDNLYSPNLMKGDLIIFERSSRPKDNGYILTFDNDTPLIRKFISNGDKAILSLGNTTWTTNISDLNIFGIACRIIRKFC